MPRIMLRYVNAQDKGLACRDSGDLESHGGARLHDGVWCWLQNFGYGRRCVLIRGYGAWAGTRQTPGDTVVPCREEPEAVGEYRPQDGADFLGTSSTGPLARRKSGRIPFRIDLLRRCGGRQPAKIHATEGGMFPRLGLRFDLEVSVIGADRHDEVVQETLEPIGEASAWVRAG